MSDKCELKDTASANHTHQAGTDKKDSGFEAQQNELYDSIKGASAASTEPSILRAGASRDTAGRPISSTVTRGPASIDSAAAASASVTATDPPGADEASPGAKPGTSGPGKAFAGTHAIWDRQAQETREELLEQFYSTLRVAYSAARPDPGPGTRMGEQHRCIRNLLGSYPRSWLYAYEIEQLLVFVMTDDQLEAELPRRMAEAKAHKLEYVSSLSTQLEQVGAEQEAATTDTERERCMLAKQYIFQRLLNDLQWFFNQRIRHRDAANRLTVRVSAMFLSAFLFFSTLLFIQYLSAEKPRPDQSPDAPQHQTESASISSERKLTELGPQGGNEKNAEPVGSTRD